MFIFNHCFLNYTILSFFPANIDILKRIHHSIQRQYYTCESYQFCICLCYVAFSKIQSASSSISNSIQSVLLFKWLKTSEQGGSCFFTALSPQGLFFCGWMTVVWSNVCMAILEIFLMIQSTQVLLDSVTSPDNSMSFLSIPSSSHPVCQLPHQLSHNVPKTELVFQSRLIYTFPCLYS